MTTQWKWRTLTGVPVAEVVSIRNGWLIHPDLELMVKSGRLGTGG